MLDRMRVPILLLVSFTLIFPNQLMQAQGSASDQIEQADQLRNEGQPKAAIAMLEPMLQPGANAFSEDDLGFAWNVLGSSYQDLEMVSKARWCYETAMEKLRSIPSARARYAAAIANLASLEVSLEQKNLSKGLYQKAGLTKNGSDMGHGGFKVQVQQNGISRQQQKCRILRPVSGGSGSPNRAIEKGGKQRTLPTFQQPLLRRHH
jgi:tetratricopeptide (TPR) repeat protein